MGGGGGVEESRWIFCHHKNHGESAEAGGSDMPHKIKKKGSADKGAKLENRREQLQP